MSHIIEQLKIARQEKKLRQFELGSKLGLPQSHISKIEHGATDPRLSTISDMARVLELELVLVPRHMLPAVRSLISGKNEQQPAWRPDEEDES